MWWFNAIYNIVIHWSSNLNDEIHWNKCVLEANWNSSSSQELHISTAAVLENRFIVLHFISKRFAYFYLKADLKRAWQWQILSKCWFIPYMDTMVGDGSVGSQEPKLLLGLTNVCRGTKIERSSADFPGMLAGNWFRVEQPGHKSISVCNVGTAGIGFTYYPTVVTPWLYISKPMYYINTIWLSPEL